MQHFQDDDLTPIATSGSELVFNVGDPIYGVSTMPFLHIGLQTSPFDEYIPWAEIFPRGATYLAKMIWPASDVNLYETRLQTP